MTGSVLERLGRSPAAEPFSWVTRAKIQSLMNEHYHRCKAVIDQHLDAYYGDRQGSVFTRSGVTATVSVELFEAQAAKLVGLLADSLKGFSRDARAFQMITEMTNGFLSYIDLVVGRIGPRIDLELRNLPQPENPLPGAGKLWAESRARVVESLDRHRVQFGLPAKPAPEAEAPVIQEVEHLLHDCEMETEADAATETEAETEFEAELTLTHAEEVGQPLALPRHWHEMWIDIAARLCTGELRPRSQGDLGGAMSLWFADRGIEGSDAEVDECARSLWRKLGAARLVNSSLDQSAVDLSMEAGASVLDRLAWQSGSLRGAAPLTGREQLSLDSRCSTTVTAPERASRLFATRRAPEEEPEPGGMRYQVSWSMRQDSCFPAPGFDLG